MDTSSCTQNVENNAVSLSGTTKFYCTTKFSADYTYSHASVCWIQSFDDWMKLTIVNWGKRIVSYLIGYWFHLEVIIGTMNTSLLGIRGKICWTPERNWCQNAGIKESFWYSDKHGNIIVRFSSKSLTCIIKELNI